MIRFITEREVNLNRVKARKKNYSQLNFKLKEEEEMPEEPSSTYEAMANFKKCDQQSEQLVRRLIVLKQQQRKMESKTIQNNSKLEFYKSVRAGIDLRRKKSQEYHQSIAKQLELTREVIAQERQIRAKKLEQTKRQMYFQKWHSYLDKRQNCKKQMNATQLAFESELIQKRNKKIEVKNDQRAQKEKVKLYHQKKRSQIRLSSLEDRLKVIHMTDSKQEELSQLSHIESLLLSRQARSRMISQESTNRLNSFLSPKNSETSTKNYSSIASNSHDIYVI